MKNEEKKTDGVNVIKSKLVKSVIKRDVDDEVDKESCLEGKGNGELML